MIKTEVIKHAGFCFGVERAYNIAKEALLMKNKVYFLGELIHNPDVTEEIKSLGGIFINNIAEATSGTLIIRAHGIPLNELNILKTKELEIIDATCPFVKVPQNKAKEYSESGYFIIIVGDENHPEIKGVQSYVNEKRFIITKNINLLTNDFFKQHNKIAIIAQTTLPFEILKEISSYCIEHTKETLILNSICDATFIRQTETAELSKKADCMIIIGGYKSANSKRLFEIAKENCIDSYQVENTGDLNDDWFNNKKYIGISAGASTPKTVIENVKIKIDLIISKQ